VPGIACDCPAGKGGEVEDMSLAVPVARMEKQQPNNKRMAFSEEKRQP